MSNIKKLSVVEPVCKICRRHREKLFLKGARCETAKCSFEKRNFPPGPKSVAPKKLSEYGRRLREKQKLRFFYGVSEQKMRTYFDTAKRHKGVTSEQLLSLLETRLDNVVYRVGLGLSRRDARQMVRHRRILVNGHILDVPSYRVRSGDVITIHSQDDDAAMRFNRGESLVIPEWLVRDQSARSFSVARMPERSEISVAVEDLLVVEFYSQ